jgi:hypothetical protein
MLRTSFVSAMLCVSARAYMGGGVGIRTAPGSAVRAPAAAASTVGCPDDLRDAEWLPQVTACCAVSGASGEDNGDGSARMGEVLVWLQQMLVNQPMSSVADGDAEDLDDDFVQAARPWLHTKSFHDVTDASQFSQRVWSPMAEADFLREDGEGGALLVLLPPALPLSLFEQITASVRASVHGNINREVEVLGCHPDVSSEEPSRQTPVPLIRLFKDSPDLLVDGGSMSDAAGLL